MLFLHFYVAGSMAAVELEEEEEEEEEGFQHEALPLQHASRAFHLATFCEGCSLANFVFPRRLGESDRSRDTVENKP